MMRFGICRKYDGPIGVAMLVIIVFTAGSQFQVWRDSEERHVLIERIKDVRIETSKQCASDKASMQANFAALGRERDQRLQFVLDQNAFQGAQLSQILKLTKARSSTAQAILKQSSVAALQATKAADVAVNTAAAVKEAAKPPPPPPATLWHSITKGH